MLAVERTLRCLNLDLCNEVLVTFATRIFNSQYKGSRHSFFDDCLGHREVPRRERSILNARFVLHPGAEVRQASRNVLAGRPGQGGVENGILKLLGVAQFLSNLKVSEAGSHKHSLVFQCFIHLRV